MKFACEVTPQDISLSIRSTGIWVYDLALLFSLNKSRGICLQSLQLTRTRCRQTFVGTGGSSGSPIIILKNGKVIGIAQQVLASGVKISMIRRKNDETEKLEAFGSSNLALVYGISTRLFPTLPEIYRNVFTIRDQFRPIFNHLISDRLDFRSHPISHG
jgi:hypothetical protein